MSINKITFSVNSICVHDRTGDLVIITSRFPYKWFEHAIYDFYCPQMKVAKVMFLHVYVCPWGRGWYPTMHCRWYPSMPCSRSPVGWHPSMPCRFPGPHRGEVEGSGLGESAPRGMPAPGGARSRGYLSQEGSLLQGGVWRPLPWWLLLQAVRILLECILVILVKPYHILL